MTGREFIVAVADALGLPPTTARVVIEADVRGPLTVYVKGYPPGAVVPAVVRAVADAAVSPAGDVTPVYAPAE
jgi:hypothetical protein